MGKFYMKYPPKKPEQFQDRKKEIRLYDGFKLDSLSFDQIKKATIGTKYDWDSEYYYLEFPDPEADKEFKIRMAQYENELAKYQEWEKENWVELEKRAANKAKQKLNSRKAALRRALAEAKRVEKELKKLEEESND